MSLLTYKILYLYFMLIFIDEKNKVTYIMAPKCGTHTIANYLNTDLHTNYEKKQLINDEYTKIIIFRKDVVDRFLSGFYEDLFNNTCYDNMDVTFNDYLLFLYKCYTEKIKNVNNLSVYLNKDIPVWYGNCSNHFKNITDNNGDFCSHIQSQKYAIYDIVNKITGENVKIIELNELSKLLPNIKRCNVKNKQKYDLDLTQITLSHIKKNKIIISKDSLNDSQIQLILKIYEEDILFINELTNKFNYCL